jgi:hypothetical protein
MVRRADVVITTTAPVYRAVLTVVSNELSDCSRRSHNVVISGVPTSQEATEEELIQNIAQTELGMIPNIVFLPAFRERTSRWQSKAIIHQSGNSRQSLQSLLRATQLRQSSAEYTRQNLYINLDLTKQEAETAYLKQLQRR